VEVLDANEVVGMFFEDSVGMATRFLLGSFLPQNYPGVPAT
jgi:hypothetical protein